MVHDVSGFILGNTRIGLAAHPMDDRLPLLPGAASLSNVRGVAGIAVSGESFRVGVQQGLLPWESGPDGIGSGESDRVASCTSEAKEIEGGLKISQMEKIEDQIPRRNREVENVHPAVSLDCSVQYAGLFGIVMGH